MFDWLFEHGDNVSVLTDIGTLIVWVVYAQLRYFSFRRQRRPRLVIERGRKKDIDALCILRNIGEAPRIIPPVGAELGTSPGGVRVDRRDGPRSEKRYDR